jgi:hypothetical protein
LDRTGSYSPVLIHLLIERLTSDDDDPCFLSWRCARMLDPDTVLLGHSSRIHRCISDVCLVCQDEGVIGRMYLFSFW